MNVILVCVVFFAGIVIGMVIGYCRANMDGETIYRPNDDKPAPAGGEARE